MGFYVYVLGTTKKPFKTYVGWAKDVRKRLNKHNLGLGAKFTRGRKWKIIYKKSYNTKSEAMKNEYLLKKNIKKRFQIKQKYQKKHKIT